MDNKHEKAKRKHSIPKLIWIICAVVIIGLIGTFTFLDVGINERKKEIVTESSLEEIINVSELSTFEAVYNGVAKVTDKEKTEEIDYYVSYEAKVKAGIDFEQVKVHVDNEAKKISITIPEVKITDVSVDIASLDYIFMDDDANTETVSQEAYKACIEDVTNESSSETAIYELAEKNANNIVEALINPFIEQLDSEYQVEIK